MNYKIGMIFICKIKKKGKVISFIKDNTKTLDLRGFYVCYYTSLNKYFIILITSSKSNKSASNDKFIW